MQVTTAPPDGIDRRSDSCPMTCRHDASPDDESELQAALVAAVDRGVEVVERIPGIRRILSPANRGSPGRVLESEHCTANSCIVD